MLNTSCSLTNTYKIYQLIMIDAFQKKRKTFSANSITFEQVVNQMCAKQPGLFFLRLQEKI
jgi:hypothetical protein